MDIAEICKYGFLKNCYIEQAHNGFCVFDQKNRYVGVITDFGFSMNSEYEHVEKVSTELANRNLPFWDDATARETQKLDIDEQLKIYLDARDEIETESADDMFPDPKFLKD